MKLSEHDRLTDTRQVNIICNSRIQNRRQKRNIIRSGYHQASLFTFYKMTDRAIVPQQPLFLRSSLSPLSYTRELPFFSFSSILHTRVETDKNNRYLH